MSRITDATVKAAMQAQRSRGAYFLRMVFGDGAASEVLTTYRYTDLFLGAGDDVSWAPPGEGAATWINPGGKFEFGSVGETPDLDAGQMRMRLSGALQTVISSMLNDYHINRELSLWAVQIDTSTGAIISPGLLVFKGRMNGSWVIEESRPEPGSPAVTISCTAASQIAEMEERRGITTSLFVHQSVQPSPGDLFFTFIASMVRPRSLVWKE